MALVTDAPAAPTTETLGAYLRRTRAGAGLTQATVAGRVGVSPSAVGQWENDDTIPSPRALHFLAAEIPGIDPKRLLALIPPTGPR